MVKAFQKMGIEGTYLNMHAKLLQSCLTLRDPMDSSPPGSSVPGILQARTLEWVAISFSNAWKCKMKVKSLSRVQLFKTPWTVAYQAPLSMGFSRQEHWSGLPFHIPPNPEKPSWPPHKLKSLLFSLKSKSEFTLLKSNLELGSQMV